MMLSVAAFGCGDGVSFNPRSPAVTLTLTADAAPVSDEPEYAGDMADALLQAISDIDYDSFSRDLSPDMVEMIPQEKFYRMAADYNALIGTYTGTMDYILTHLDEEAVTVMYEAEYTEEPDGVSVTVSFTGEGDDAEIIAMRLNSPKLRGE